jgi:predicted amidophosphoribosyltransferase
MWVHLNLRAHIIMCMANMTISLPKELCEKMKRHPETKWSEVARKALSDYVDRLEIVEGGVVPMKTLAKRMKEKGFDPSEIDLEQAIKFYEEGRKLARKRLSTIQANL